VASALVFAVLELLPGDAAQVILGDTATPESVAALREPSWAWTVRPPRATRNGWAGWLQGRTADSISYDTPTAELIAERLQVTAAAGRDGDGC
jgi:peptide/nickel transport system permease protein